MKDKLNLGCGNKMPSNWINVNVAGNPLFVLFPVLFPLRKILVALGLRQPWKVFFHDLRNPLPFPDQSMSIVYASHLLEHLYLTEAQALLKECYRVLRSGGVIRIVVPDLRSLINDYLQSISKQSHDSVPAADRLNERLLLRHPSPPGGSLLYRLYLGVNDFHTHKWVYDVDSLTGHIRKAGFSEVAERGFLDSRISDVQAVEMPGRVLGGEGICVEGVKP